jgi:hypothetical protein
LEEAEFRTLFGPDGTFAEEGRRRFESLDKERSAPQRSNRDPAYHARLRERVGVEHKLARLVRRQGRRTRYRGVRKNLFDLRRASAIQNLEAIQRKAA